MGDIPALLYSILWEERDLLSAANLTRKHGLAFLRLAPEIGIAMQTAIYPLRQANEALKGQRAWRFEGAAVLVP